MEQKERLEKIYGKKTAENVWLIRIYCVDFKKTPPTVEDLKRWENFFGALPVNKKGPTFRKIKDEFEAASAKQQLELLLVNTSAIKRPILESGSKVLCFGYDEDLYKKL